MNYKPIIIVAGEPNSVFFEIFFKCLKKNYFKTIRNRLDKRSIFILPTELTIKIFSSYVDKRAWLYKFIK